MLRRLAVRTLVIGAVLVGFAFNSAPAHAAAGDSVAAVVTGTTRTDEAPPLPPDTVTHRGAFTGVVITGVFVATGGPVPLTYAGSVDAGDIEYETTENLAQGRGTIDDGTFRGSNGVFEIEGGISNGDFERVGTVAVASLDIRYTITGPAGLSADGEVSAQVTVTAVPGAGDPPTDLADALIVGTVVGEGTNEVPDIGRLL